MDRHILQVRNIIVEPGKVGRERFFPISYHFVFQVRFFHFLQNQFFQMGEVRISLPPEMDVFIHGFFQFLQLIVGTGLGLGRRQVGNEDGAASPFRLDSFAGDGHVVGVHIGQVPEGQVRIAGSGEPCIFAGQPFQASVGTHMDHGVRLPFFPEPLVEGNVVVGGGSGGRVVYLVRVFAKSPGRLDRNEYVAVHGARHQ